MEVFHELRKRVKYCRYHVRLLRRAAPSVLEPRIAALHELTDALGDAHDLANLAAAVRGSAVPAHEKEALSILADGVRVDLECRSLRLAKRLLAEETDAYVDRLASYYRTWRNDGPELETGGLDVIAID